MTTLVTERGEFFSFAAIRGAYMRAHNGHPDVTPYLRDHDWDPTTLHISELGKCPRKQMLRLSGAKPRPRRQDALDNDELMFWQGNMIHALTAGALDWAGDILVSYEEALMNLPSGWSGSFDIIYKPGYGSDRPYRLWDGKTVRQNAFDYWYEWPKPEVKAQLQGYLAFVAGCDRGEVEYIDRGGSNPPQVHPVYRDNEYVAERMHYLNSCRRELPALPDPLEPVFKAYYRKANNLPDHLINSIYWGNSWECEWCDYLYAYRDKKTKEWSPFPKWAPCKPRLFKEQVAKTMKGELVIIPEHEMYDECRDWLRSALTGYRDPEPEDETQDWSIVVD